MTGRRVGTRLLRWAARWCDESDLSSIVFPTIADMQFEDDNYRARPRAVRAWVRVRGYLTFWRALSAVLARQCRRGLSQADASAWLRLVVAAPIAILTASMFQGTAGFGLGATVYYATGSVWMVKVVGAPLAAAIFVWTMCLVAPKRRRRPVAVAAMIVIGWWGSVLMLGGMSAHGGGAWVFSMGAAGTVGGAIAALTALRAGRAVATTATKLE